MRVVFGWGLDGLCFPERLGGERASLGDEIVGPMGLVSLFETRLGLRRANVVRAKRVVDYLALLRRADGDGGKFYSASLRADAWATADYLLGLRDELVASGWRKEKIEKCEKVAQLADVEQGAGVAAGFGERLQGVIEQIGNSGGGAGGKPVVDEVVVIGEKEMYPALWRRLFDLLVESGVRCEFRREEYRGSADDLKVLQRAIQEREVDGELRGDGSVCVIDADDEVQATEMVAAWMAHRERVEDVVMIRGGDCSALSEALKRYGLPSVGNTERSRFRAVLQVLPLAFELVVRPVDPRKVVEFLYVQGGPIPRWVAEKLLWAMGEAPGIGGEVWNGAWDECVKRQAEWVLRDDARVLKDDAVRVAREKMAGHRIWFDAVVAAGEDAIRCVDALEVCKRVERWVVQRLPYERENAALFEAAGGQARVLRGLIERVAATGEDGVSLTQLRKMIEGVMGYGVSMLGPEAAGWSLVNEPGQIWGKAPYVVWWGFAQASRAVARGSGWTDEEVASLAECGVYVESTLARLRRESALARMAVLNAERGVVIVKPRVVAGEAAVNHPLWDEMVGVFGKEALDKVTVRAVDVFGAPEVSVAGVKVRASEKERVGVPQPLRNWVVAPDVVRPRVKESYSSIEKLLGCPLAWTLHYKAEMWPSKALELPEKQLLLGKLAHAVVKKMHDNNDHSRRGAAPQRPQTWDPDEAEEYSRELLARLIPEMASGLLLPGAARQLREAQEAIPASVRELTKFLRGANAVVEGCEVEVLGDFREGTAIGGAVDMVVRLQDGRKVVLDFKWSSSPYWYRKKIIDGKALQLAIYSWLLNQKEEALSPAGFFMFRHSELFFTEDGVFPRYAFVRKQKRTLQETWNELRGAYEREMGALKSGRIVAKGVEVDERELEEFAHEELADPPCLFCKLSHFCGKTELH